MEHIFLCMESNFADVATCESHAYVTDRLVLMCVYLATGMTCEMMIRPWMLVANYNVSKRHIGRQE